MRTLSFLGMSLLIGLSTAAGATTLQLSSKSLREFKLTLQVPQDGLALSKVQVGHRIYTRIGMREGIGLKRVGLPEIPFIHRYLAVDPDKKYRFEVKTSDPVVFEDVLLYPVQPDYPESAAPPPFTINRLAYLVDVLLGQKTLQLGEKARLGRATVLPVTFTPFHYNPVTRRLILWQRVDARVYSADIDSDNFFAERAAISSFQRSQFKNLVENGAQLIDAVGKEGGEENDVTLVITSEDLVDHAGRLAALYRDEPRSFVYETVDSNTSSSRIRELIEEKYTESNLDSVLFLGDENRIKLYWWTNYTPGDSWYSFIDGNDKLMDIAIGRLPVSDTDEADYILARLEKYREIQNGGQINKNVMLIAHKENYPGKYTANQERIREAENPREFVFNTQYGGAGATSDSVVEEAAGGYAVINYRGHGSSTTWSSWGRDGRSFGTDHIKALENYDEGMAVFFNIACSNGALQKSSHSMAENILFTTKDESPYYGGVGVIAATVESATYTNHDFDENLFMYLQTSDNITLGNILALANNKLVRDNGGSMPGNVRMYILFGDPLLKPWLQ